MPGFRLKLPVVLIYVDTRWQRVALAEGARLLTGMDPSGVQGAR